LINQLRAILLERGIVIAQGRRNLERELDAMLCEENGLAVSPRLRKLIEGIREEWQGLDRRIAAFDDEFAARAKTDELVGKHLKADIVGRMAITSKDDFRAKVRSSMRQIQNNPEKLSSQKPPLRLSWIAQWTFQRSGFTLRLVRFRAGRAREASHPSGSKKERTGRLLASK
jgi:hypothetical protein